MEKKNNRGKKQLNRVKSDLWWNFSLITIWYMLKEINICQITLADLVTVKSH
jgi:hypothetical protein